MLNSLVKNYEEIKPDVRLRHEYLNEAEIQWICNRNSLKYVDISMKYINISTQYYSCKNKYPFIEELNDVIRQEYDDDFILSNIDYIKLLICYGRIEVPQMIIHKINWIKSELHYIECPVIDVQFINQCFDVAVNKLKYSKLTYTTYMGLDLYKIFMYYQCKSEQIAEHIDDYYKELTSFLPHKKDAWRAIRKVMRNMNYKLPPLDNSKKNLSPADKLNCNVSEELISALNDFGDSLSKKSIKTKDTKLSHIRTFYRFLNKEHPEITSVNQINNKHIVNFKKYELERINCRGKTSENSSINNVMQAVDNMWMHFIKNHKYKITNRIVTKYDFLIEPKVYPKKISREEAFKLIQAVINCEDTMEKQVLVIHIFSGRRIHEVITLKFDCLSNRDGHYKIYFHKVKNRKSKKAKRKNKNQPVNDHCVVAVMKAREYAKHIKHDIYSKLDDLTCRRLFPSTFLKGETVISTYTVNKLFERIQINNGFTDANGEPMYSLHDNKRNFVSELLSIGVTIQQISVFLGQEETSFLPYEVDNEFAIKTLKAVEEKGLLIGNKFESNDIEEDLSETQKYIFSVLNNIDIVTRNRINLETQLKTPGETMPLIFASCMDNSNAGACGELLCLACKEVKLPCIEDADRFGLKMYKQIYRFKRYDSMKKVEKELLKSLKNAYESLGYEDQLWFDKKIRDIKSRVRMEIKNDK